MKRRFVKLSWLARLTSSETVEVRVRAGYGNDGCPNIALRKEIGVRPLEILESLILFLKQTVRLKPAQAIVRLPNLGTVESQPFGGRHRADPGVIEPNFLQICSLIVNDDGVPILQLDTPKKFCAPWAPPGWNKKRTPRDPTPAARPLRAPNRSSSR